MLTTEKKKNRPDNRQLTGRKTSKVALCTWALGKVNARYAEEIETLPFLRGWREMELESVEKVEESIAGGGVSPQCRQRPECKSVSALGMESVLHSHFYEMSLVFLGC